MRRPSGQNLTYDLTSSPLYGKGIGPYACQAEVDAAGFKSASP